MRGLLSVMFIVLSFMSVCGQPVVQRDTGAVQKRNISAAAIASFKSQKQFQYDKIKEPATSLWDRFWSWFWFKIAQLLSTRQGQNTAWTLLVLFVAGMVALFVFKFTGMNKNGLFGRQNNKGLQYTVHSDDINTITFEEAITNAETSGNFRLGIRLHYLQVLKNLLDKGFINWQIDKTNSNYIDEVATRAWASHFTELTQNFEYTWYGEAAIDQETYASLQQKFQSFNRNLK